MQYALLLNIRRRNCHGLRNHFRFKSSDIQTKKQRSYCLISFTSTFSLYILFLFSLNTVFIFLLFLLILFLPLSLFLIFPLLLIQLSLLHSLLLILFLFLTSLLSLCLLPLLLPRPVSPPFLRLSLVDLTIVPWASATRSIICRRVAVSSPRHVPERIRTVLCIGSPPSGKTLWRI